ncbi:MAG: acylphosphatase [Rhodoblastus sp.]|nr:MAG: acylphosphatase [Rhodoblastus sp.]
MTDREPVAWRLRVSGRVQGVGYRDWTRREAVERGLAGWVRNRVDGTVEVAVAGDPTALASLRDAMRRGPFLAKVAAIQQSGDAGDDFPAAFEIRPTA